MIRERQLVFSVYYVISNLIRQKDLNLRSTAIKAIKLTTKLTPKST